MKEFGGVSRRDSELRDAVVQRIKRRRQWQVVQGETCESGAKVDREPRAVERGPERRTSTSKAKPIGLPTKTEERQHQTGD